MRTKKKRNTFSVKLFSGLTIIALFIVSSIFLAKCSNTGNNDQLTEEEKKIINAKANDTVVEGEITVEDLAYHWAPIHYQDINPAGDDESRVDYITRLDRDVSEDEKGGVWDLSQNWDEDLSYPLRAYVYYSVVSTGTHFYITYSYFHPWDTMVGKKVTGVDINWVDDFFEEEVCELVESLEEKCEDILDDYGILSEVCNVVTVVTEVCNIVSELIQYPIPVLEFEKIRGGGPTWKYPFIDDEYVKNDLEGVLFVVKRDGNFGQLEAVLSQGHGYLTTYLTEETDEKFNAKRKRPFLIAPVADPFAMASMEDSVNRIITTQEAGGHGAGCYPDWGAPSPGNYLYPLSSKNPTDGGGDHIRYIPSRYDEEEEPNYSEIESTGYTYCKYKLINNFGSDGLWTNRHQEKVFNSDNGSFLGHAGPMWNWRGDKEWTETNDTLIEKWDEIKDSIVDKLTIEFMSKVPGFGFLEKMTENIANIIVAFVDDMFNDQLDFINTHFAQFYSPLNLTTEEKQWVCRSNHPWSHNPAQLSWVYLNPDKSGYDKEEYFSNNYDWNPYREDMLGSIQPDEKSDGDTWDEYWENKPVELQVYSTPCEIPGQDIECCEESCE